MAFLSFSDVWRAVSLHSPQAPHFLIRQWVSEAYEELCTLRGWGFLRCEGALSIRAARSFSVGVTLGDATVTSAGLFVASDEGRQFRISGASPIYTILSFTDASNVELDRVYGDATTAAASATILDAYATMPENFGRFLLVTDPYNQRRLAYWITQDQLNLLDPTRMTSDAGPRSLAALSPSTVTATLGRMRYEYWPAPISPRTYPYWYVKTPEALADDLPFGGVLGHRASTVLTAGALVRCSRWPGLPDKPNPYFNLGLARDLETKWQQTQQGLSLSDDNQTPDDLQMVRWDQWPLADIAYNDQNLRASDATLADFY